MSTIDALLRAYDSHVRLPWNPNLSGPEKVWMVFYDPPLERRLRFRLEEFAIATQNAGHPWKLIDLTDWFAEWMSSHPFRDSYFEEPDLLESILPDFADWTVERVMTTTTAPDADQNTVVAICGLASLFGLMRASTLLSRVADSVRGRLVVFFPGHREGNNYRMLDAHDGWDYLAVPITAAEGD